MNQTGVRSTGSRRQARTRSGALTLSPLELRRELGVDAAEHERGDHEPGGRDRDDVDDVAQLRKLAPEEWIADRLDERRHRVAPVEDVGEARVILDPGQLVEGVEDRRQD